MIVTPPRDRNGHLDEVECRASAIAHLSDVETAWRLELPSDVLLSAVRRLAEWQRLHLLAARWSP